MVAVSDERGGYLLYAVPDRELYPSAQAAYEIYSSGEIHRFEHFTHRRIQDLTATGCAAV